jgi:hypothetical protein
MMPTLMPTDACSGRLVGLLAPIDADADRSSSADRCWCRSVFVPIYPSIGLLVAIDVAIVVALPVAAALPVPIS